MTEMQFDDSLTVVPIDHMGSDATVVAAARVSTTGADSMEDVTKDPEEAKGLIRFLMSNRHGTPFEHNAFTFFVQAPIAVFREYHRHRIGFSYNEESGRYKQLEPHFYVPPVERPLVQVGKPGHYTFVPGTAEQHAMVVSEIETQCTSAYESYERMLNNDIAKEVSRGVLPVYLFSSMWVTCNARSIMSFLSLRTTTSGYVDFFGEQFDEPADPIFPSFPMWEIEQVGLQMERAFAEAMPITHSAFRDFGSVSP